MIKLVRAGLLAAFGIVAIGAVAPASAAAPDGLWSEVRAMDVPRNERAREIVPDRYRTFTLNRGLLTAALATAPREELVHPNQSRFELLLPLPDGSLGRFKVVESPVMEPALQAKYPQIRTYLGQGIDDPSASVRFDLTPHGFHAQIIGAGGTAYVDPFQPGDLDHYIAYRKADHTHGTRGVCEVTGEPIAAASTGPTENLASGATLRTYRLALAATGEYTQFHGGTVIDGLSAVVTTVNRVDGIYEREVAVRMVLVANDDLIIYTNPATDPYANTSNDLNANQTNINNVIGSANYDIGHLVGTGGGGIAGLGVVCGSSKAQGLTGSPAPVADGFDIDYVAHEMGHQFDGNHTFNGSGSNCSGGNRNASTAYEPGSGITIQAYAGICGADDLQPHSEDYFHRVSLNEIIGFTTSGGGSTCGTTGATGNTAPSVSTGAAFTIPGRTPFTLSASGSDADGDPLTYVWEQFDLGAANTAGVLDDTVLTGPLFRGFDPGSDPTRTFPSWRYILNNANVVPGTAPLPGTTTPAFFTGEKLPNATRTLNFRVTVRDNKAGGGGTNEASTILTVNNTAGPFQVTAPNTAVSFAAGSTQTVTWTVASTNLPPVSTANVRITLSVDGGYTWPYELLASTPNDGSQSVTLPAGIATTQARVRVEAVGNIYFDVSDVNFTITSANNAPSISVTGSVTTRQGSPTASAVVATISDAQDAASALAVSVTGAPPELGVSVQNDNGSVTLFATAQCGLVTPTGDAKVYPVVLRVADTAGNVSTAEVNVNVADNLTPTLGTYPTLNMVQNGNRTNAPDPLASDANGNFLSASVTPTTLPGGGTVGIAADGTVTVVTTGSTPLGTYTVKPSVADTCGAVQGRQFDVVVGAPQISLAVAGSQVTTGNGLLEPNECNQLDVSVRNNGNTTATGVSAVLSTSTPNVTITQASSAYVDIPAGESRANTTPFQVSSASGLTCFSDVNLTLTVSYSGAGSPFAGPFVVTVGQPLGTNYVFTASGGATLPNDGVLLAGSHADDVVVDLPVPAGFNFSVYGTAVTGGSTLRISTNGNLQLRSTKGANDPANTALPATSSGTGQNVFPPTAPTLFLQWDDWQMNGIDSPADSGIYTKVEGSAPNRNWFIEWRGRVKGDGALTTNNDRAAIVFHEGSNSFDYVYLLTGVGSGSGAAGSTIGVQAASSGTTFTQYALDNAAIAPGTRLTAAIPPAICTSGGGACGVPPGVTIVESGGATNVTEGGATDTYTVVLNTQPSSDVTVTIAPDAQVTTSPTPSLTFTTANWNIARTVTVTAVNDAVAEGAHTGTITHSAAGGGYDAVVIANVVANITDNDTKGVTVTQSGGTTNVTEGGATDSYTLVLTSQPTSDVTITITPDTQVTRSPTTLTFTTLDWNTPQPVTVTAVDDAVAEGAHTGTITHSASGGGYTGVAIANVVANITDNDTKGVTVAQSGGTTNVTEGGATDSYTLVLTSQPTSDVTITISPDTQVTTSPAPSVTFTTANWNTPQPITVTAVDDAVFEGAHTGTITHSASGGGYTGVSIANVVANVTDNDTQNVDLAVTDQLLTAPIGPGERVTYAVDVENLSGANVATAQFAFTLPGVLSNVSWVCVADPGASCPASGNGAPSHTVALNAGTGVSYGISADVPPDTAPGTEIVTTATVSVTTPYNDTVPANNTASTTDTVGPDNVFSDGFED